MIRNCTLLIFGLLLGLLGSLPVLGQAPQLSKYQKGTTEKGQKVGVWEYYGYTTTGQQVVVQRYDHDKNKLVSFREVPYATYFTEVKPGEWRYVQPDQPPMFVGGTGVLGSRPRDRRRASRSLVTSPPHRPPRSLAVRA